ncbi:M20 family metallopeptidase [Crassaminicella profunda]|uniref:M20 family metallopeptidase n=1 Tax=Crassaminicella profunda TaxID=1286698 RepID=UPI001CA63AAD|nr:M20 family metallopeptidase [Crassaminicella profunda]QZY55913.1 M20 family metallopeptidase [Crassaminicella profunda]
MEKKMIGEKIDGVKDELLDLTEKIHAHPEVAFEEYKASGWMIDLLRTHGFLVDEKIGGLDTAFRARFKGKKDGPKIAFIAEYDALPKIGHGCGHNIIATCSVGAAIGLSKCMKDLAGEVILMGTPAEEGGGGKIILLENNEFNDVDYALMIHPTSSRSIIGRGGLAATRVTVEFRGRAAHSSSPERGINALSAVIQTFNGIDALRPTFDMKSNINGIITKGGDAANIIPEYARSDFSVRARTLRELEKLVQKIKQVVKASEILTGAKATVGIERMYAERYPNMAIAETFKENMKVLGEEMGYPDPNEKVGSSDIGNVTLKIPAIHSYLKIAEDTMNAHSIEFAHAAISERAKEVAIKGAKGLAMTGYDILTNEGLREKIKKEFEEKVPKVY